MKVDITNRTDLNALLQRLTEESLPAWGVMRPQNMVEHLATTVQISNGKRIMAQRLSDEETLAARQTYLFVDADLPKGMKTPLLGEGPAPFEWPSLQEAISQLNAELDAFERYFAAQPGGTSTHPRFGPLDHKGWVHFHGKHFTHHFRQFGLV
ncbi:hypothetical protein V9K67_08215 [Paraflavisolibacter sp. H34]|uniref:hypothetical protein n=1 Tax=Huijunlia imazamoxiresistens TaxID=3127457 RepID=UPI003016ABEF